MASPARDRPEAGRKTDADTLDNELGMVYKPEQCRTNVTRYRNHACYPPAEKGLDNAAGSWEGSLPELRLSEERVETEQVELDGITKGVHK